MKILAALCLAFGCALPMCAYPKAVLDLSGYADESGAITVQHRGDTIDPYFALQALLLASDHGLDTSRHARPFAAWLLARQKPDGTFDRFCRQESGWAACKTADADDSQLALWLRFLESDPAELKRNPAWTRSHDAARASLVRLQDKSRGIYMVSPVFLHGLFMDNLEVWSYGASHAGVQSAQRPDFGRSLHEAFWDAGAKRYLVSTQLEQRSAKPAFYPDAVAQVFPLLVGFPHVPGGSKSWWQQWRTAHRAEWLKQVEHDFAWGLIAVAALDQQDPGSVRCWLRAALPARAGPHWTATDEVVAQVAASRGIAAANTRENCA